MAVILGVAVAITALLLPLSVYPGVPSDAAFLAAISSPFWLPAACLTWWTFADFEREVSGLLGRPPRRRRWLAAGALILLLNCGLLWCGAPRRLAFLHSLPAFEASIATAPRAYSSAKRLDRRFGVYHVDQVATDPRGGIYYRTRSGPDGFQMKKMTYGFSHRPNAAGSPFGDEKYALTHIVGEWYSFRAGER
jgi:hypothetical protein